jgi:hypothetical protein
MYICCAPETWFLDCQPSSWCVGVCAVLLIRLLSDRIRKLRAARAQWSEIGVDDWEISQSDVKCAYVVASRLLVHVPEVAAPCLCIRQAG